jgi:hypothetical protein
MAINKKHNYFNFQNEFIFILNEIFEFDFIIINY